MLSLFQRLKSFLSKEDNHLFEMATIAGKTWGGEQYRIAIRGVMSKDRSIPHVHIYLERDHSTDKVMFNFEISLVDIIAKDEVNLIYQMDKKQHLKKTHRKDCSWTGYRDILDGFKSFINEAPIVTKRDGTYDSYIEKMTHEWNKESSTDYPIINPLKEYFLKNRITILPKYQKYFD